MADIKLDDLFELGKGTVVKEFYLPIDESVAGFDKGWLRKIVLGEGTREEKVQAIKSHEYIQKGDIIAAEFEKLGLQFLFYADGDKKPLKDLSELVFYADNHGIIRRRLNELDSDFMYYLDPTIRYRNYENGYTREAIDPRVAGIKNIGNFEVDSFGPKSRNGSQQMSAIKTFESQNGKANLKYSASLNPEGVIDEFDISLEISSGATGLSDFLARIDVKNVDGKYVPQAEVRVKSERARQLGSSYGLVSYHFDPDGQFDYINLHGSELVYDRKQIKGMEKIYANLEGVVWHNGEYCLKITDDVKNANINALLTGERKEHHAISEMKKGSSVLGTDYQLVPVENLGAVPGLAYDLLKIQDYRKFIGEFSKIGLFKNLTVEKVGINYVDAIMNLAGFQSKPAHDVLLLS